MKKRTQILLCLFLSVGACGDPTTQGPDKDKGPIDEHLDFADRVNWPGLDYATGRQIQLIRGFGNGRNASYWFLGFASRRTADSFWFCREGDEMCPLDEHQRLNWDAIVGHPLFTQIPGMPQFSPFWQMWKVTVPADFEPDAVKTVETLDRLKIDGEITVEPLIIDFGTLFDVYWGPQEVVLHCALVLQGTQLGEMVGLEMPDGTGPVLQLQNKFGWHQGYRVEFIDFSPSDGVFPKAEDSALDNRPRMPFANIYIHWRPCPTEGELPEICDPERYPGHVFTEKRPVSERGLGQDFTGDGDANDANNTMGALPCEVTRPEEKPYSPLWGINFTTVTDPTVQMVDTNHDQLLSDIMSAETIFANVDAGRQLTPEPAMEDETGNPVEGNDGQIFFNCPNPVPEDYVPFPCQ